MLWPPAATATCSTCHQRHELQRDGGLARSQAGGAVRQPVLHPDPPDLHPGSPASYQSKLTLMSESLRNDGRVWVPKKRTTTRAASADPRGRARLLPGAQVPELRQPGAARRRLARNAKDGRATRARASARSGTASTSTSPTPSSGSARTPSRSATATSSRCTSASPTRTRTRCRCASTRRSTTRWAACGWTTTCMSNVPGLFVLGEANFSDHGANRLGASALMQGLADGYFVIPLHHRRLPRRHCSASRPCPPTTRRSPDAEAEVNDQVDRLLSVNGKRTVDHFHRELGKIMWDYCGMARNEDRPREGPRGDPGAARGVLEGRPSARRPPTRINQSLEKAGRVADFLEFGELMVQGRPGPRGESAAATSARSHRPRRARPSATTRTSRSRRPGSSRGSAPSPPCTRKTLTFEHVPLTQRSYK